MNELIFWVGFCFGLGAMSGIYGVGFIIMQIIKDFRTNKLTTSNLGTMTNRVEHSSLCETETYKTRQLREGVRNSDYRANQASGCRKRV